ncbi:hypothetical protein LLG95_04835 [bacterium]|nr:hypothetical protein [bacterium]
MLSRPRQFTASLRANPLFVREWRRVFGRWYVFPFRIAVFTCVLYYMNNAIDLAVRHMPFAQNVNFFGQNAAPQFRDFLKYGLLNPAVWIVTWMSWRAIAIEHRRGTAQALALTYLGNWDLFWAKALPTMLFPLPAICISVALSFRDEIRSTLSTLQYYPDSLNTSMSAYYCRWIAHPLLEPLAYMTAPLICHAFLLRWPVFRRNPFVIVPVSLIFGILFSVQSATWIFFIPIMKPILPFGLLLLPLHKLIIFTAVPYVLMLTIAPRFRHVLLEEPPAHPICTVRRARIWLHRFRKVIWPSM